MRDRHVLGGVVAVIFGLTIAASVCYRPVRAEEVEFTAEHTIDAIGHAAQDTGVPYTTLYFIIRCETGGTFNPRSEGDGGHSHGAAQINDYGNAKLKFYEAGYTDVYNPYEAVYFTAEALAGMHPPLGRWTWNC